MAGEEEDEGSGFGRCGVTPGDLGTSIEEAVGQMLMIGFRGDVLYGDIVALLRDIQPGGVVLFDYDLPSKGEVVRNITSPQQLRALTSVLQDIAPFFIAVDAEGGYVNRLKRSMVLLFLCLLLRNSARNPQVTQKRWQAHLRAN